jgi:Big-like domain-containing protein
MKLVDANGIPVSGRTITLTANAGSHATISPASGLTSVGNGTFTFTVTDLTAETVTFTATNTSDGITLPQTATIPFVVPPASSAGIIANPTTVAADGVTATTITVTLKDALMRPTPGKLIRIDQGNGHSVISGPNPAVTDKNGQI